MSETTAAVVLAMFAALSREDVAAVLAICDEQIEVIEPASLPFGGRHQGLDAFRKNVLMVIGRKLKVRALRVTVIGEGETVAVSADVEFTARASGAQLRMPYAELYTVRNGKIARIDVYPQDTQRLLAFWNDN